MYKVNLNQIKSPTEFVFLNKGNFFVKTLRIFFTKEEFRLMSPVTSTFFFLIFLTIFIFIFIQLNKWFIKTRSDALNDCQNKDYDAKLESDKIIHHASIIVKISYVVLTTFLCFTIFFLY